ncbi:MAG: EAL domain-containing protein [Acidimicrobiales bacterium]
MERIEAPIKIRPRALSAEQICGPGMAGEPAIALGAGCVADERRLVAAVNQVIDRRAVTTLFQPLVDLETAEVVGYEALSRGPAGSGVESPQALFNGALLAGRLSEFDWMCAARACDAVTRARLHPWTTIFLNLKPATVMTTCPRDLLPSVKAGQDNLRIVVEMDEDALTDDPATLFDAVRGVRQAAWGLSIDNAGAGPAALALLPLVRPDVLKLDFRGMRGRLPEIAQMAEGARAYSERTGATVLAQGIEDLDDLWAARLAGASFAQGWYFGRPGLLPPELHVPTAVIPLVQGAPVLERATPFEIISGRHPTTITNKRLLLAFSRQVEDQVDTNGPPALLLETFEAGSGGDPRTQARLHQLAHRAAFLAVVGGDIATIDAPTVRTTAARSVDPIGSEWNVIVLGPHYAVAVAARGLDEPSAGPDRRYEYAVTHDRDLIVRAAVVVWGRLPKKDPIVRSHSDQRPY